MKVLFFMRSINYDRHFESLLRVLGRHGHEVHVALDLEKKGEAGSSALFEDIAGRGARLTWDVVPEASDDGWEELAEDLRTGIDWLRYLEPRYASSEGLRRRAQQRAPSLIRKLATDGFFSDQKGRGQLDRLLRAAERSVPLRPEITAYIAAHDPHVVLVSPLIGFGSPQGDYLRSARSLGIPTALAVASWDNLTNKGLIRDRPDLTIVWNEAQRREATELHGLPEQAVRVTGAHTYDHWFGWSPTTSRDEFCEKVGLRSDRPFFLYVCSSNFIAPDETSFVDRWHQALRDSGYPALRDVGVLIRPHPANAAMWESWKPAEPGLVAVYPRAGASPTDLQRKADYFDSIHHSRAVVGINTSAMIESAIVGRGVFTVLDPEFAETQAGTLHFAHLSRESGGVLSVAGDMEEHARQLAAALEDPRAQEDRARRFVEGFVRPLGREVAAAPAAAEALEELGAVGSLERERRTRKQEVVRATLTPVARSFQPLSRLAESLAIRPGGPRPIATGSSDSLRILFVLDHPGLMIHFDETIRALADQGHNCLVSFRRADKFPQGLEALGVDHPGITLVSKPGDRQDAFRGVARQLRVLADYAHFLHPSLKNAEYSRQKLRKADGFPAIGYPLKPFDSLPAPVANGVMRSISAIEAAIPSALATERRLEKFRPDLVIVSPLINRDSYGTEYVKSARRLGIPSAVTVASWDNLSSKGLMRVVPDRVIVWNETQRREAVEMHAVPDARIVSTGAQQFDRWFNRPPTADLASFCARVGLPNRRYALFVGSTRQTLDERQEIDFARRWIEALRSSDSRELRELPVVIRPHPVTVPLWRTADFNDLSNVVIWDREDALPVVEDERADYYDTLFHSAVVFGINSSAMIEAAIIGRPVHTVRTQEFWDLQGALIHYRYLLEENGGFLREASNMDEHLTLLQSDLEDPSRVAGRQRRFAERFIRPHGIDRPAQPFLVEAILDSARIETNVAAPSTASAALGWAVLGPWIAHDRIRVGGLRGAARAGIQFGAALKVRGARLTKQSRMENSRGRMSGPARAAAGRQLVWAAGVLQEGGRIARRRLKTQGERLPVIEKPPKQAKAPKPAKPESPKIKAPKPAKSDASRAKPSKPGPPKAKARKPAKPKSPKPKSPKTGKETVVRADATAEERSERVVVDLGSKPPVVILDRVDAGVGSNRPVVILDHSAPHGAVDRPIPGPDPRVILD